MPQDLTDKSTLVQVMAWCCQATSHYLNQCWPRSPTPYGVTRSQWVKGDDFINFTHVWQCICCSELGSPLGQIKVHICHLFGTKLLPEQWIIVIWTLQHVKFVSIEYFFIQEHGFDDKINHLQKVSHVALSGWVGGWVSEWVSERASFSRQEDIGVYISRVIITYTLESLSRSFPGLLFLLLSILAYNVFLHNVYQM